MLPQKSLIKIKKKLKLYKISVWPEEYKTRKGEREVWRRIQKEKLKIFWDKWKLKHNIWKQNAT